MESQGKNRCRGSDYPLAEWPYRWDFFREHAETSDASVLRRPLDHAFQTGYAARRDFEVDELLSHPRMTSAVLRVAPVL